jgi:hypothetical protein
MTMDNVQNVNYFIEEKFLTIDHLRHLMKQVILTDFDMVLCNLLLRT